MENASKFNGEIHHCRSLLTNNHCAVQTDARGLAICIRVEVTCADTADELHDVIENYATAELKEFLVNKLGHY